MISGMLEEKNRHKLKTMYYSSTQVMIHRYTCENNHIVIHTCIFKRTIKVIAVIVVNNRKMFMLARSPNLIFYLLEIVSRYCVPQLQVGENYSYLLSNIG